MRDKLDKRRTELDMDTLLSLVELKGVRISNVTLVDGEDTSIPHKLGRKWTGWRFLRIRNQADAGKVYDVENDSMSTFLTLHSWGGTNLIVDLWVF